MRRLREVKSEKQPPLTVNRRRHTGFKILAFPCLLFTVYGLFLVAACQGGKPKEAKGDIAALVNGEPITRKDLDKELKRIGIKGNGSAFEVSQVQQEVLAGLIERKLLLQQVGAQKIQVSKQELQTAIKEYSKDYTAEDFARQLKEHQLTQEEWQNSLQEELLIRKLEEEIVRRGEGITDQQAFNYYKGHPQEFEREEQIRARHIMVKDQKEAEGILTRLRQGADFVQVAKERSQAPDAASGGDLGYFRRGQMPEEFEVAFSLRVGQLSGVVHSPYGYHIFKTEDRRRPHKRSFDEAAGEIKAKLAQSQKEEAFSRWLAQIKNKAEISVNPVYMVKAAPESLNTGGK